MEFPVELEEAKSAFSIAKSTVDIITRLWQQFQEPEQFHTSNVLQDVVQESHHDETDQNEDRKDCIREAILILNKETQSKKSSCVEKFVENTLLNPECELEPSTIFTLLKDIEQMTWRQFCLLEGFKRNNNNEIEIAGYGDSGINGISRGIEIKKLIDLNCLLASNDTIQNYSSIRLDRIRISTLGQEISNLLDLQSVEISEIGKAFGGGRIRETVTY